MDFLCDFNCTFNIVVHSNIGFVLEKSQKIVFAYPRNIELFHATIAKGLNKRFAASISPTGGRLTAILKINVKGGQYWH